MTLALTISHDLSRQWLFPETGDIWNGAMEERHLSWIDSTLNEEQKVGCVAVCFINADCRAL